MRMSSRPRKFGGNAVGRRHDSSHLQPSKNDVKFRRIGNEAKRATNLLSAPKASEEEKQVTRTYVVTVEMALRGPCLPEDGTPSRSARDRTAPQIGIQMRGLVSLDPTASKVFNNFRD